MYKIQINTKSKNTYILNCQNPNELKEIMEKAQFIVVDDGAKGMFIPFQEVAEILFEKLPDAQTQPVMTTDSQEHYPSTDQATDLKNTIEGDSIDLHQILAE